MSAEPPTDPGRGLAGNDLDMDELFGSSDDDERETAAADGDENDNEENDNEENNNEENNNEENDNDVVMDIPTSLHDALPPSRNHLAKLPPSVRIVSGAFREDTFEGEDRDGIGIRWRYGLDDRTSKLVRESNARVVTWSDGSRTLHIGGNTAVYQMKAIDISKDDTYLYASHARLIQCQGKLLDKLMFNPISVKQAGRPKNQSSKSIKVKQTATLVDPVKEREAKERSEEARIREKEKLAEKQRQMERNAILKDPNFARRSYYGTRGLSAAFLEEDDEEGGRRMVNEEEYDEDDGWLLGDDEDMGGNVAGGDDGNDDVNDEDVNDEDVNDEDVNDEDDEDDEDEDIDDVADAAEDVNGRDDPVTREGGAQQGRTMPGPDAEQRNEATLMNIMVEGKATDQGAGGEPKKKRKVISSDSDDE